MTHKKAHKIHTIQKKMFSSQLCCKTLNGKTHEPITGTMYAEIVFVKCSDHALNSHVNKGTFSLSVCLASCLRIFALFQSFVIFPSPFFPFFNPLKCRLRACVAKCDNPT